MKILKIFIRDRVDLITLLAIVAVIILIPNENAEKFKFRFSESYIFLIMFGFFIVSGFMIRMKMRDTTILTEKILFFERTRSGLGITLLLVPICLLVRPIMVGIFCMLLSVQFGILVGKSIFDHMNCEE